MSPHHLILLTSLYISQSRYLRDNERGKFRFPGKSLVGPGFLEFVKSKALPLVGEWTSVNGPLYTTVGGRPVLTVFAVIDSQRNLKGFQYLANRLRKVAALPIAATTKVLFNIANLPDFQYELETDYGFQSINAQQTLVGMRYNNYYFAMTEEFSFDAIARFLQGFEDGTLKGKLKVSLNSLTQLLIHFPLFIRGFLLIFLLLAGRVRVTTTMTLQPR
jgi:hypothetical protein